MTSSGKSTVRILTFAALFTLLPYFLLAWFIFPVADDLSYAQQGADSIWQHYKINYLNWCGRYTSNFLILLNCYITPNLLLYRLYPIVLIFLILISVFIVAKKIKKSEESFPALLFSILFTTVYLNMLPNTAEGLYWFTGSATYILPAFLFIIYILLINRYITESWIVNKYIHFVILMLLAFTITGFNESLMLLFTCIHIIAFVFFYKQMPKRKNTLLFISIICIASSLIIILAPGNENRSAFFPLKHQLLHSLLYSSAQTARFILTWIFNPSLLLFSILYIPFAAKMNSSLLSNKFFAINPFFVFCCLLFVVFCATFPPYWATGMLGQHRTLNTVLIVFLLLWILFIHLVSQKFIDENILSALTNKTNKLALFCALIFTLLLTGNGRVATFDLLSGKTQRFKQQQDSRNYLFIKAQLSGQPILFVDTLKDKPASIFVLDISTDSTHWINYNYASYYGLKSVRAR